MQKTGSAPGYPGAEPVLSSIEFKPKGYRSSVLEVNRDLRRPHVTRVGSAGNDVRYAEAVAVVQQVDDLVADLQFGALVKVDTSAERHELLDRFCAATRSGDRGGQIVEDTLI